MKVLLDSHAVLWAVDDPSRLGPRAVAVLRDSSNELLVSAATIWELAIKIGLNKLRLSLPYREWMMLSITDLGLEILPITVEYADVQAGLPNHHRDPFDRLLVAQALVEGVALVSGDAAFDQYGITRLW